MQVAFEKKSESAKHFSLNRTASLTQQKKKKEMDMFKQIPMITVHFYCLQQAR